MQSLNRFLHLPRREQALLFQAALAILLVRLTLVLFSMRTIGRLISCIDSSRTTNLRIRPIILAVGSVARFMPGTTCLVQALAAQFLLMRHGHKPSLTIGVTKDKVGGFAAHAWVTCENEIVIGAQVTENYLSILCMGS